MKKQDLSPELLKKANSITGKRARLVVDIILEQGYVTTEDLKDRGYDHPPRAIKDVTDQGLPLLRTWTKSRDERKIARYEFGKLEDIRNDRLGGRQVFSHKFKQELLDEYGNKCCVCATELESRYLQIDHRVPYEVAGDSDRSNIQAYMPLCASCNRAKSWSCEHCQNCLEYKDAEKCNECYWASPQKYTHIALCQVRRLDITWNGEEINDYESIYNNAAKDGVELPAYVKMILRRNS